MFDRRFIESTLNFPASPHTQYLYRTRAVERLAKKGRQLTDQETADAAEDFLVLQVLTASVYSFFLWR